jgi:hypothetical protein
VYKTGGPADESVGISETSANFYQTRGCNIKDYSRLKISVKMKLNSDRHVVGSRTPFSEVSHGHCGAICLGLEPNC